MKQKKTLRVAVNAGMTAVLLLLMGYSRVGETAHEWLGIAMTVLFALHHILNRKWTGALMKGRYTPYRVFQTLLAGLIFCTLCGSAVSGVILSRHVFRFLGISFGASFARTAHMLCGYWNFVLMSLHLGLHWITVIRSVSKRLTHKGSAYTWAARIAAALIAGYGVFALIARKVPEYLFGITSFAFFDNSEPLMLFLLDYMAVMALFVWIGHYLTTLLKKVYKKGRNT